MLRQTLAFFVININCSCNFFVNTPTPPTTTTTTTTTTTATTMTEMRVSIKAVDATTNLPIQNASIVWRSSHLQYNGNGQTNGEGLLLISRFYSGDVLELTASKLGFIILQTNLTVQFNPSLELILTLPLSPDFALNEIRIVLSWNPLPK